MFNPPIDTSVSSYGRGAQRRVASTVTPSGQTQTQTQTQALTPAAGDRGVLEALMSDPTGEDADETVFSADDDTALAQAEQQWLRDAARPIDVDAIAALVDSLRLYGPAAIPGQRPASIDDLTGAITPAHVDRFHRAMGIDADERQRMDELSFRSGLLNPMGGLLSNILNYGVAPMLGSAAGNPWVGTGFSVAVAFCLQAVANALQQTAVVTACEHIRERGPTVVIDKNNIHDGNWIGDLPHELREAMDAYACAYGALAEWMVRVASDHGVAVAEADAGRLTPFPDDELRTALERLTPDERADFGRLSANFRQSEDGLQARLVDMLRAQGSVRRQQVGNFFQAGPRLVRSGASTLLDMLRGVPPGQPLLPGQHTAVLGSWPVTGLKNGLLVTGHALQMASAGADEKRKQQYNNLLNMLFADVFTASGEAKVSRGEPISGADVDPAKVRKLVASPATALVQRMTAVLDQMKSAADERIGALEAAAAGRATANPQPMQAADRLERGSIDLQFRDREHREYSELRQFSADLERDRVLLRQGNLRVLAERPGSFIGALLTGSVQDYFSGFLAQDIRARYARPGEFSSQLVQRISSMFIGFTFGTAVSSTVGKLVTSSQGGSSEVSRRLIGGVAGLSFFFAGVGALTQYILISIKNHRRLNPDEVSAVRQLWRGILAPWYVYQAEWQGPHVMRQANALLDRNNLRAQLDRVFSPPADAGGTSA